MFAIFSSHLKSNGQQQIDHNSGFRFQIYQTRCLIPKAILIRQPLVVQDWMFYFLVLLYQIVQLVDRTNTCINTCSNGSADYFGFLGSVINSINLHQNTASRKSPKSNYKVSPYRSVRNEFEVMWLWIHLFSYQLVQSQSILFISIWKGNYSN